MRQIDPTGVKPIIEPLMPAQGYGQQPSVKPYGRRVVNHED
ncbi:hypothetical protein [Zavarzinella formosa]|nr:hypothetical protein [Zavarzinella formosa]